MASAAAEAVVVVRVVEEVVAAAEKAVGDRRAFSFSAVARLRPCRGRCRVRFSISRVLCDIYLSILNK